MNIVTKGSSMVIAKYHRNTALCSCDRVIRRLRLVLSRESWPHSVPTRVLCSSLSVRSVSSS